MSTARPELPYLCIFKAKSRVKTSRRGKLGWYNVLGVRVDVLCHLATL